MAKIRPSVRGLRTASYVNSTGSVSVPKKSKLSIAKTPFPKTKPAMITKTVKSIVEQVRTDPYSPVPSTHWFLKNTKNDLDLTSMFGYEGYPSCCGACILFGFSNYGVSLDKIAAKIRNSVGRAIADRKGMVLAIVNHNQGIIFNELVKFGFEPVFKTTNPVHNDQSVLHLLAYNTSLKIYDKDKLGHSKSAIT